MTRLRLDDEGIERRQCRTGCGWMININGGSGPVRQSAGIDRVQGAVGHGWNAGLRRTGGASSQLSTEGGVSGRVGVHAACEGWCDQQDCRPNDSYPGRATHKPVAPHSRSFRASTYPIVADASKPFSCHQWTRSSGCRAALRRRSAFRRQQRRPASGDSRPPGCANCCLPPRRLRAGADRW